jgi:hypothetical protein
MPPQEDCEEQEVVSSQEDPRRRRDGVLVTELSFSSIERMTLKVEIIFWFISHTPC